jgi:phosphoglycerol transferase MdoB-like AlkP superfamily enzyme
VDFVQKDGEKNHSKFFRYRSKTYCLQCDELWYSWMKLIVLGLILLLIGIVTLVFFALSSTKMSHLTSLSIAWSFWQIISLFASFEIQWPWAVETTLTAASTSNFNVIFNNC